MSGLSGSGLVVQNNAGDDLAVNSDGSFTFPSSMADGSNYSITVLTQPGSPNQFCSVSNASGVISGADVTSVNISCSTQTYTIGGSVSGLSGSGLVLQNNAGDDLAISSNGSFTFSSSVVDGGAYSVSVLSQPGSPTQSCIVSNGSGTLSGANISNVAVSCSTVSTPAYTIGGSVSGLSGSGLVLQNNGGDNLTVYANGSFSFPTPVTDGNAYSVNVLTQPGSPTQSCTVSNGGGMVSGANVTSVSIACTTQSYTVGGNVTGLTGSGLVLFNNSGESLSINANGSFSFANPVLDGNSYAVSVQTQPGSPSQNCTVNNGSGAISGANVSNVSISCTTNSFTIGGTVSGLSGSGLVLQNNGGDNLAISSSGSFTFPTSLLDGSSYAVTVQTQPGSPNQTCTVSSGNGNGTVSGSNVVNVSIACITQTYTVGGSVTGLAGSGLVLQNNGGDNLNISGNGSFTFPSSVTDGGSYSVSVQTQPGTPAQSCTVGNGSGSISGSKVTNVSISCSTLYTIGGSVTGLSGSGLVLQNNGGDNLSISADGSFIFPTALTDGSSYSVSVQNQPGSPSQTCTVSNASGTLSGADITNVSVSCPAPVASYTLSGTVSAATYTYSDSDLNDTYASSAYHTSNSDPTSAQLIGNPAIVGGYASEYGIGYNGADYATGDYDDFYKVTLTAGDSITLYTADTSSGTYSLYLTDPSTPNTAEAWSQSGAATQTVTAPSSKTYLVWVYLNYGYGNYTLTIGNTTGAGANNQEVITDNFVPDQLLVTFKSDTSSSPAAKSLKSDVGMSMKAQVGKRAALMDFSAQHDMVMKNLNITKHVSITRRPYTPVIPGNTDSAAVRQSKQDTLQVLRELRKRSDIQSVDLNYIRQAKAIPSGNADYANLWSYPMIGMDSVWSGTSITGSGSIVAVIDTGVLLNHPDLSGQLVSGYDFISSTSVSNDGDGIDADPSDPGDNPGTSSFHGTHVSGTIAAANNTIGSVGIAYGAKVMPLRALGVGGGTDADIMQAMLYAAGLSNASGTVPAQKADVINMSLGGYGSSTAFQDVVNQVRNAGVIIIAAAGNDNTSTLSYPASYDGVVSVSAIGPDQSRAYYSNYGSMVDVAAPGGDQSGGTANGIYSTLGSDSTGSIVLTYGYYQGTSMATPHVAAVAALMKEANPSMTPADFDSYLASGNITDDLGTAGRDDYFGYGMIDAAKAVSVAGTPIPAYFTVDPSSLTYISNVSSKTITVANGGTVAFTAPASNSISYTSGSGWLTVTPGSVDGYNLGTYTLDVDRTGLATGEYTATVTFSASGVSDYVLNVTLRVGLDTGVDAGYQYIALVNADTGTRVATTEVAPSSGLYAYSFSGVPAGNYYIYAGTDMDNDGNFCDTGEACGSYSGTPLAVSADASGLNFSSQFDTPPTSRSGYAK